MQKANQQSNQDEFIKIIINRLMENEKIDYGTLITKIIVTMCFVWGICDMIARS